MYSGFDVWDVAYSFAFTPADPAPAQWYGSFELNLIGSSVGQAGSGSTSVFVAQGVSPTFTAKLTSWITSETITSTCAGTYPQPEVSLGAAPASVGYGESTNLSWSSQNADSCTATSGAGFSTGGATSGSDGSSALTADETFTVTCTGPGGTASDSVSVAVALPPLSCSLSDTAIQYGGSVDASATGGVGSYSWSTPGANVSGSGSNIVLQYLTSGTYSVNVSTPTSGQSAYCGDVYVSPAGPYAYLAVIGGNPVNYNSSATLQWEGGGGDIDTCIATQGPGFSTGGVVQGTDQSSVLTTTTQFTVVCSGPTSTASDSRTVYVNGAAPACDNVYPQTAFTSATSGTLYAYAEGVTGASEVLFPTWGDTGGQDDLTWYQGVNLGGGRWRASIDLGAHKVGNPEYGNINVHVYARSGSYPTIPDGWCGAANFTRSASAVPDVVLGISPSSGTYPQVATLTWTTTNNPTSCVASSSMNDWTGAKAVDVTNSETLVPAVGGHTYTVVCSNASGTDSDTVSYTQNACAGCSPSGSITITPASPCTITPPATNCNPVPQVSWSTTNVTNAQLMISAKDPNTGVFGPYTLFNSGCSPNNPSGLPRSVSSSGGGIDEYVFKLYSAPDCFTVPGGGLTGTVVLMWDDAYGSIPSGWTCISCAPADPFYGQMPRLTDAYGGTGGADTHTHALTFVSQTTGSSRTVGESGSGGFRPQSNHQHTWNPVTTDAAWNLPPYKHLKFISRTNPPEIPANAIALFDAGVPSGWTRYTSMD
ncbi:MAG: GBS Bsp-like repeat-containing protein, partial [Candidatus Doudnabacteria bacterium]|nr:GBS Bsp-like repeat-containing protein [Candidatus Doudnabacteria bacterium]